MSVEKKKGKKEKPGALFFFDEWNDVIASYPYEEVGKLTHCALLYAQGKDNTDVLNSLCPQLQGVWGFIARGLERTGRKYKERLVITAWGGYKKNHNIPKDIEVGSDSFLTFYVNSSYYEEALFQDTTWYDSVLEYANYNSNPTDKNSLAEIEAVSENETEARAEARAEVGEGFRERENRIHIPSASETQIIKESSAEELKESLKRLAEQKGNI